MMQKKLRILHLHIKLLSLFLIVTLTIFIPFALNHESILEKATLVRQLGKPFFIPDDVYLWRNDNQLLLSSNHHPAAKSAVTRTGNSISFTMTHDWGGQLYLYDTSTHIETFLVNTTNIFNKGQGNSDELKMSPDGLYLLWPDSNGTAIISMSDNIAKSIKTDAEDMSWFGNTHRIVSLSAPDASSISDLNEYDLATSKVVHHWIIPANSQFSMTDSWINVYGNHIVASSINDNSMKQLFVSNDILQSGKISFSRIEFSLPAQASSEKAIISSDGKRIAWLLSLPNEQPFLSAMKRVFPSMNLSHRTTELWVSEIANPNPHKVADVPMAGEQSACNRFQWLPGGKKVSFIYKDALYTAPVD